MSSFKIKANLVMCFVSAIVVAVVSAAVALTTITVIILCYQMMAMKRTATITNTVSLQVCMVSLPLEMSRNELFA